MIITKEYIMEHRTKRGAWTKAQLEALGISWPAKRGWIHKIVGKQISNEQAKKFESGVNVSAKQFVGETKYKSIDDARLLQHLNALVGELKRRGLIDDFVAHQILSRRV